MDFRSAYENSVFCETFHSEESGWRECRICGKVIIVTSTFNVTLSVLSNHFYLAWQMVHCGCIASRYLYEYMEFGGVACISCAKRLEIHSAQSIQVIAC